MILYQQTKLGDRYVGYFTSCLL